LKDEFIVQAAIASVSLAVTLFGDELSLIFKFMLRILGGFKTAEAREEFISLIY
jgi:hypothetical protein